MRLKFSSVILAGTFTLAACSSTVATRNAQRSAPPAPLIPSAAIKTGSATEQELDLVAFGSCSGQDAPQPIWDAVVAQHPDLFLFLGDNIYADTEDMTVMRAAYERQAMQPGIRKLFASTPVMATWDDHDYGRNDAGVEYPKKREAQREFLRFFGVPQDSPMWRRDGVYSSSILGPPGKRVQVIMLDTRYFRSPMQRWSKGAGPTPGSAGGPYKPSDDENATVLGEAQWLWLEDQLRQEADVRIIATSIQAVAGEHGYEAWINFPVERTRLFEVIRETEAKGVVLLSGDRHLAEISVLPPDDPDGVGYPLYDVTSSSLNRPSTATTLEPNKYRVYETNYRSVNYGTIVFDWSSDPTMRMQIRNIDGTVVVESVVRLSDLQPGSN